MKPRMFKRIQRRLIVIASRNGKNENVRQKYTCLYEPYADQNRNDEAIVGR
jgi:hypothetical protein